MINKNSDLLHNAHNIYYVNKLFKYTEFFFIYLLMWTSA